MKSITPALKSAGWLLNMLWLAPAMFRRLTSGRSFSSLSVTGQWSGGFSFGDEQRRNADAPGIVGAELGEAGP
jgi:hypothetical protein